jgi:hypothetical protein
LAQVATSPRLLYELGQTQLDFNQGGLFGTQLKEFGNGTRSPTRLLQVLLLCCVHNYPQSIRSLESVVMSDSFLASIDNLPRSRSIFLREDLQNHNRVVVDPIDDSPGLIFIGNTELMTPAPNFRHWSRVGHAQLLPSLQLAEQQACLSATCN